MINGKIADTILTYTKNGMRVQLAITYKVKSELQTITTDPININTLENLAQLMAVANAPSWEEMMGQPIQFNCNDTITEIADFYDEEKKLSFQRIEIEEDSVKNVENSKEKNT